MAIIPFLIRQFPYPNGNSLQAHMIYDREGVKQYIQNHPELINASPKGELTPLAVATILGNQGIVGQLLGLGANPLATDRHNWTPIHFAVVLGHVEIENKLIAAAQKIDAAAIPKLNHLRQTIKPVFPERGEQVALQKRGKKFLPITGAEFERRTGARFYNGVVATPFNLLKLWEQLPPKRADKISLAKQRECLKLFAEYEKKPPCLYLDEEKVCIHEGIDAQKVVGFFGGEINMNLNQSKADRPRHIDTSQTRNLPTLFSDGVPNCIIETIELDGIPRHLFISTRKIRDGEKITIDLGPGHPSKFHYVPVSEETITFYRNNTPASLCETLQAKHKKAHTFKGQMEVEGLLAEIGFLFSTPHAVVEMALNGTLDIHQMHAVLETALKYTIMPEHLVNDLKEIFLGVEFLFYPSLKMNVQGFCLAVIGFNISTICINTGCLMMC